MYHRSNLNFIVPLFSYDSWHATFPLNTKLRIQGVILHFSNWSCNHGGCTFLLIIRGCKSTSGTFCAPSEFKSTPLLVSQEFIAVISTSMEQVEVNRHFESRCYLSSRTATWRKKLLNLAPLKPKMSLSFMWTPYLDHSPSGALNSRPSALVPI